MAKMTGSMRVYTMWNHDGQAVWCPSGCGGQLAHADNGVLPEMVECVFCRRQFLQKEITGRSNVLDRDVFMTMLPQGAWKWAGKKHWFSTDWTERLAEPRELWGLCPSGGWLIYAAACMGVHRKRLVRAVLAVLLNAFPEPRWVGETTDMLHATKQWVEGVMDDFGYHRLAGEYMARSPAQWEDVFVAHAVSKLVVTALYGGANDAYMALEYAVDHAMMPRRRIKRAGRKNRHNLQAAKRAIRAAQAQLVREHIPWTHAASVYMLQQVQP